MHWWLYLFLAGYAVEVRGHFDTLDDCKAAGDRAIADWRDIHSHSTAFRWCVQGGKADLGN